MKQAERQAELEFDLLNLTSDMRAAFHEAETTRGVEQVTQLQRTIAKLVEEGVDRKKTLAIERRCLKEVREAGRDYLAEVVAGERRFKEQS